MWVTDRGPSASALPAVYFAIYRLYRDRPEIRELDIAIGSDKRLLARMIKEKKIKVPKRRKGEALMPIMSVQEIDPEWLKKFGVWEAAINYRISLERIYSIVKENVETQEKLIELLCNAPSRLMFRQI